MTGNTTRRRLLRSLAVGGVAVAGGALVGRAAGQPPYTHYTYAQVETGDREEYLRIAWYATRDGTTVRAGGDTLDPATYLADAPEGPVVAFDGLLPGDSGTVVLGLLAEREPTTVWFRPELLADDEGSLIEPERAAGDSTPTGELGSALAVDLWLDGGVMSTGIAGCNGRLDPGESLLSAPDGSPASGPLTAVAIALDEGVQLSLPGGNGDCPDALGRGESACLAMRWSLPAGTNDTQTDSLALALRFVPVACGDTTNPFAGGVA